MQALWMVLAAFMFASMGVCVKLASAYFNPAELVCYRGFIGMAILALLARSQGTALTTRFPGMHAWRSLVGVTSLGAWFYAIAPLPLATAITLNYMSSVWIAAFLVGGTLLAWRPTATTPRPALQGPLILTVLAGFAEAADRVLLDAKAPKGRARNTHRFLFCRGLGRGRWRGPAGHRHLTLAGMARTLAAAHRGAGRRRATMHDARLRQCAHPARHARGGQPAVFRDRLRVHFQCAAV